MHTLDGHTLPGKLWNYAFVFWTHADILMVEPFNLKRKKIPVRTIFNRVSIVIRDSTGFGLQGSMIDPENSTSLTNQTQN